MSKTGKYIADDDPLLEKAREYAQNGKKFLEKHVPGWLERAQWSHAFDMWAFDYCALAISCKATKLNGHYVYSAGDVVRAYPGMNLGRPEMGFYPDNSLGVTYNYLQIAWEEIFERGTVLKIAA